LQDVIDKDRLHYPGLNSTGWHLQNQWTQPLTPLAKRHGLNQPRIEGIRCHPYYHAMHDRQFSEK
jgi:hypothetical protein